jgi:hypothetical protein
MRLLIGYCRHSNKRQSVQFLERAAKDDSAGQAKFIGKLFGIAAQFALSTPPFCAIRDFRNGTGAPGQSGVPAHILCAGKEARGWQVQSRWRK